MNKEISSEQSVNQFSSSPWGDSYTRDLPPFNPDQNSVSDIIKKHLAADKAREQQASSSEALLYKPINIDSLISDGDAEIARYARAIEAFSFSAPGQAKDVASRLSRAEALYAEARKHRDAERTILEEIQDDPQRLYYSQEELLDRIREYQQEFASPHSVGKDARQDWLQLSQACSRLINRLDKFNPSAADHLSNEDMNYWQKITSPAKPIAPEALIPRTLPQDKLARLIGTDISAANPSAPSPAPETTQDDPPASYHFEGGLTGQDATITVGQAIPDSWFESKVSGSSNRSGFGVNIVQPPQIETYLQQALNIEFSKLSAAERSRHNYSALANTIMAEAKRTKKVPDIARIISRQSM